MSSSGPDSKSIPPDLSEVDRGPFFNFYNLMKFADPIDGKALPCPKLIDNSKFESTLYTDSLNRVAKITRKPEITVSSSSKAVSEKPNADKPMDVDLIEDSDAKSSNSEIYGSILDLNPNFSISALVAEVNLEIEAFSQWGENKKMKSFWKGLSQNEKKNILLGLQFRLPGQPDSEYEKQSGSILNSRKEVQNLKKRNKVLRSWSNLKLKQRVKMLDKMGSSRVQNLLRNQVKKEIKTKKKMTPLSSDLTPMKKKAIETSIGLNRIRNGIWKKYQNPDNIPSVNNVFKVDVEEMSALPVNDKKPQTKLVAAADLVQQVTKETKVEVKKPISYADTVGKKKQMSNLISVIQKDPKLKVGEVEMPVDDILKGSEPFSTTLYGYFIEKRMNYYNMNKYAMSKWKQFGIEGVMVNEEGFSSEQGVKEVLEGGPWLIFDNPIVIRRWTPGLNLSKSQHNSLQEGPFFNFFKGIDGFNLRIDGIFTGSIPGILVVGYIHLHTHTALLLDEDPTGESARLELRLDCLGYLRSPMELVSKAGKFEAVFSTIGIRASGFGGGLGLDIRNTMSKYTPMRFDVEKYDGRINFGLWQVQVKDMLIQSGLHKALKGKPAPVSSKESSAAGKDDDEEWDDLDLRAASAIRLSLAKNVLANVHGISTEKELWEKLEQLYQGKGISNRLYLKEQFHTLRMNGDTKFSDHLSVLNNIVSELEAIEVKVEDEDKALRLILSLSSSYEHMKPILMYGKETLKYADVTGKLLSEEKRLESSSHTSSSKGMCGQSGHVKRNCPGGADSVKGSDTANMVSIVSDGDDFL
ncbi:hypothetical protein LXL04_007605 [Taraxacum kok-saghyz]